MTREEAAEEVTAGAFATPEAAPGKLKGTNWYRLRTVCPRSLASRYSYRSATIGSTRAALRAGIQHASKPVASNNKTVLAKVAGS